MKKNEYLIFVMLICLILLPVYSQSTDLLKQSNYSPYLRGQSIKSIPSDFQATSWFEKQLDWVDGRFSQGLAYDGAYWYFSEKDGLYKTDENYNMLLEVTGNQNPIPDSLRAEGFHHIGDIACFQGNIYAPIEEPTYTKPVIITFDADSLKYTGFCVQVPQAHFPWIAADPNTGLFYSSEFSNADRIFVYDSNQNFALVDQIMLSSPVDRVQGGAVLDSLLYLSCDNGDYVYSMDIATGTVNSLFSVLYLPEMEGIEACKLPSGLLHFIAETGLSQNLFYHYDQPLPDDIKLSAVLLPEPEMPIFRKFNPQIVLQNVGMNVGQNINVTCIIDNNSVEIYRDTQIVSDVESFAEIAVVFKDWSPTEIATYNFTFISQMANDMNALNDTLRVTMDAGNIVENFNAGTTNWVLEGNWVRLLGKDYTWGIATMPRPYQNNMNAILSYLPSFDFSTITFPDSIGLSFWMRYWLESGKDFCYLEVSSDSVSWQTVADFTGITSSWEQKFVSLNDFTGPGYNNVQIRFRFVSDSLGTDEGINLDDIQIYIAQRSAAVEKRPDKNVIPDGIALYQNYPNPFNPSTVIEYELHSGSGPCDITLEIFNILGERIKTFRSVQNPGKYSFTWDGVDNYGNSVPSGVYYYRIRTDFEYTSLQKMLLMK